MKRWQQSAARRHDERSLGGEAGPRPARRRPEWNAYLTDDARYKLNQQQQLQRQLQHLSTAHFSARTSPSHLASRRRVAAANAHSSDWSTPRGKGVYAPASAHKIKSHSATPTSGRRALDTSVTDSAMKTARTLQFTDEAIAAADGQPRRRRGSTSTLAGPSISFRVEDEESEDEEDDEDEEGGLRLADSKKANLQGELAVLERMLRELETEAGNLSQPPTPRKSLRPQWQQEQHQKAPYGGGQSVRSPSLERAGSISQRPIFEDDESRRLQSQVVEKDGHREISGGEEEKDEEQAWGGPNDEARGSQDDAQDDGEEEAETRLGEVCFKSLEIGLSLARKMDALEKEVDEERSLRKDQELKVEMLEQEVRSTHSKYNYLEAKYQSVHSQLGDMREAATSTEEAIRRMAVAFELALRKPDKASRGSTLGKKVLGATQTNEAHRQTRRAATPKKSPLHTYGAATEHQENWPPNNQHQQRQHFA